MAAGDPPTTPPVDTAAAAAAGIKPEDLPKLAEYERRLNTTRQATSDLSTQTQDYTDVLGLLQTKLNNVGVSLTNANQLIGEQRNQFGLVTAALLNTKEMFKGWHDQLDSGRLGSYMEQTQSLIGTIKDMGPATLLASSAGQKLIGILKNLGGGGQELTNAIAAGGGALAQFAKNVLVGADNTLRFESILLHGAASGGALSRVTEDIGKHMEHLNTVAGNLQATMTQAAHVTGISNEEMINYYASMSKTNEGYEALSKGIDVGSTHMNALTAVTRLAQGAGLDTAETFKDINKVIYETGMQYRDAMGFVGRFADVSKDLHAPMTAVHEALLKVSTNFSMFIRQGVDATKMNQGLTDSVKGYAAALEAVGVPAQTAINLATQQVNQMSSLNEAQEAFIDQTTGGPGGIRGALEMEDLIEKDPAAAQRKMVDAMKQAVGGRIISREEAMRTGQEQQYLMQRQMLMQGTLGMKAGSRAEAQDMIEAMAHGVTFQTPTQKERDDTLRETMQAGKEQQALSYTGLKEANLTAEEAMITAGTINLGTVQKAMAAGTGEDRTARGINVENQRMLRQVMGETPTIGKGPEKATMEHLGRLVSTIGPMLGSVGTSLAEQATAAPQPSSLTTMGTIPGLSTPAAATQYAQTMAAIPGLSKAGAEQMLKEMHGGPGSAPPAGRQVGAAIPGMSGSGGISSPGSPTPIPGTRNNPSGGALPGLGGGGPVPVTIAGGAITMNLTGVCPHCKNPITTSLQGQATNVAANPE